MKINFETVSSIKMFEVAKSTTVGYWAWSRPLNHGDLTIYCTKMSKKRFMWAVFGHECLESLYCWIKGITTEMCDKYDQWCEEEYKAGRAEYVEEMAFRKNCPYRWGHVGGTIIEYIIIYGLFASWSEYEKECYCLMGIA